MRTRNRTLDAARAALHRTAVAYAAALTERDGEAYCADEATAVLQAARDYAERMASAQAFQGMEIQSEE